MHHISLSTIEELLQCVMEQRRSAEISLTTEQEGQLRVCWCSLSMACSLLMGAEGPALGKGPPPPRVSAHFRICAIILQRRLTPCQALHMSPQS